MIEKNNRLEFVDSMRGFAALYVLIYHIYMLSRVKPELPYLLEGIVKNGGTGVTLFFVISAFTLCYTLKGSEGNSIGIQKFYIRRIFRIVPLYYVWLLVIYIWRGVFTGIGSVLPFLFFSFSLMPGKQEGIVPASWTLGVEMIFYLLFPFILRYVQKLETAILFFFVSLIIAIAHFYISASWASYKPHLTLFHQLPVFAIGIVLYYVYEIRKHNENQNGVLLLVIGFLGFVIMPSLKVHIGFSHIYVIAIFYALIFLGLSVFPLKFFVNKISVFAGMISYSLYLNHPQLVNFLLIKYMTIVSIMPNGTLGLLACYLVTLIPLIMASYLTYKIIEKPSIALGKSILTKYYSITS